MKRWWHQVDSDEFIFAVNYWWHGALKELVADKRMISYYARVILEELVNQQCESHLLVLRSCLAAASASKKDTTVGTALALNVTTSVRVTTAASAEGTAASVVTTTLVTEKAALVEDCTAWLVVAAILAFTSLNDVKGILSRLA
ncbi:hypothetical protein PC114_g19915 [Phytophthora cactorum]|uniref:Uncharacterized protein n=1 Tax=Phytophthora cactorum TaxID=29920 RepID=A0A8T1B5F5_9STRA|nr:hypothetical protein PC114_g19915 [Phytophthora cactorum]KAG2895353.1 hypothetical protein PC115_g17861 [Phytophthora cactorum]